MTKYAGTRAAVVVAAGDISLAIAKRLAEGGARVVLTADTEDRRAEARAEVGSAAQAVAPAEVTAALGHQRVDFLFTDAVAGTSPLLPGQRRGGGPRHALPRHRGDVHHRRPRPRRRWPQPPMITSAGEPEHAT
ncbi:hypothetical protein JNUCC0626_25675 [Lentzea sp. JNUCC 0626]|uniref:hypothetical protein n=1 Tax=Lentzea sp. JNUCC 0626 TaxID=3367513 RepID=UPI003748BAB7